MNILDIDVGKDGAGLRSKQDVALRQQLERAIGRRRQVQHVPEAQAPIERRQTDRPGRAPHQQDEVAWRVDRRLGRSEEHTSELQSLMRISYADFCLKTKN